MTKPHQDGETQAQDHDHDRGLAFDLRTLMTRRNGLLAIGFAGLAGYLGFRGSSGEANATGLAADGSLCIADPTETAGPFPADGTNSKDGAKVNALQQSGVVRTDIRPSFNGLTPVAEGVQLDLVLTLVTVNAACAPLVGHAIYLWHCDAEGVYSLYGKTDRNYCRGVGITGAAGQVTFTTVFPACYDGRWPHMHFEVFADEVAASTGDNSLLISQFALPADVAQAVYAAVPLYASSVANLADVSLTSDMVFSDNTAEQVAAQTMVLSGDIASGFTATATIGIVI